MLEQSTPQHPSFIPPQPSFVPEAPPPPSSEVMSGPKDQDVERILNQINEFREDSMASADTSEPTREINIGTTDSQSTREVTTKKRRGRPPKQRPDTSSFALNI